MTREYAERIVFRKIAECIVASINVLSETGREAVSFWRSRDLVKRSYFEGWNDSTKAVASSLHDINMSEVCNQAVIRAMSDLVEERSTLNYRIDQHRRAIKDAQELNKKLKARIKVLEKLTEKLEVA